MPIPSDPAAAVRAALDRLEVPYDVHEHPAVHTVDEALSHWSGIDATHCKNLFLRNKKGNRHYLLVAEHNCPIDLRRVSALVGDDRLSFGSPERLMKYLGLSPGAVSPFGLINDSAREVVVVVDAELRRSVRVGFHPNVNTATLVLATTDFERFLASTGNPVKWLPLGVRS
jgi:Ala-tRNA(Pro) deacylase